MKKISTSALAKILEVNGKDLFILLNKNGFTKTATLGGKKVERLTQKGINIGGELKTETKFGDYIIWPNDFNPYVSGKINNISFLTASQIAENLNISVRRLNMIISEIGWMEKTIKGWEITSLGENIGGKQITYSTTGKEYIKWPKDIIDNTILQKSINHKNSPGNEIRSEEVKKDKELLFREKFPANSRAKDGHKVRSRGEMLIDNALYDFGLVHAYERKLPIEEDVYSDFYLPAQNGGKAVYIEYWGIEEQEKYQTRKKTKQGIYKKYNLNLIELENKHIDNLDDYLPKMLLKYNIKVD